MKKTFGAGGGVYLRKPSLHGARGVIANAVAEAVSETASVDLGIRYSHYVSATDTFSLDTNIGDLIIASLKKTAEKYLAIAEAELVKYVQGYLSQYIDSKYVSKENLETLLKIAKGDKDAAAGVQKMVNAKVEELTKKIQGIVEDKVDELISTAEEKLDEAKQQAQYEAAKAEAEVRRRAEELEEEARRRAQALEDEAKRKAEESVKNALRNGFGGLRF